MSDPTQKSKRSPVTIVLISLLAFLVIAGLIAYPKLKQRWSTPLGPALELPTYTPSSSAASIAATVAEVQPRASGVGENTASNQTPSAILLTPALTLAVENTATATVIPTATPKPLCGGPPVMTVLAVGADNRDNNYLYGLGDVIRIVRVDFVTPKVTALSIPRDLWVEIPGISDHYDITHGKLNQSYLYGGEGMGYYDGPGGGPGLMARTLDQNFGLRVDHYGAVNMETFKSIVDAVGGIDIYLPTDVDGTPIDDKTENMGYFYAGQHHFNGTQALKFARIRKRYNDFTRQDFQNMVVCALKAKVTSPEVLPKIPKIIAAFRGQVQTDLSLEQMSQMACLLPKLKRENIIFTGLPQEIFSPSRQYSPQLGNDTFVLEYDNQVVRGYVEQFMSGAWPTQPDEPTCP
jgi:LCP family protein required for cell wall assembly